MVRWALTHVAVVAAILTTAACPAEEAGTYVSSVSCLGILDRDDIASRPVRITRRDGTTVAGRIRSLSEGTVTLSAEDWRAAPLEVSGEEISSIGYWVVAGPRKSHAWAGMVIGGAVGFLLGYLMADPSEDDFLFSEEDQRNMSGTLGMLLGAGLGALVGHSAGTETVEAVEVNCAPVRRDTP